MAKGAVGEGDYVYLSKFWGVWVVKGIKGFSQPSPEFDVISPGGGMNYETIAWPLLEGERVCC